MKRKLQLTSTAFLCLLVPAILPAAGIDRIEPPSWWQGFRHTELQLLVYGEGIADCEPSVNREGIAIASVVRGNSRNYLFVYLSVDPKTPAGDFDIAFRKGQRSLTHRYSLHARNQDRQHVQGFSSKDAVYLITPDRFANGDPANDAVEGFEDKPDRRNPFGRHGGDIAGIRQHLDYIADMGFTQIWLNPLLENAMPEGSYHGYATTDYYRVDPRLGSNAEYRQLVREARSHGIGIIMDMIPNHVGSRHRWIGDLPAADWLNSPGEYRASNHARSSIQDPYASQYDTSGFTDGWFSRSMPDLNQRNPLLADYLIQNAIWWVEYLGLSGIRIDTYSFSDKEFLSEWTSRIMSEFPDLNMVGEEWSANPAITSYWQAGKLNHDGYVSHLPGLMDFPLQAAVSRALTAEAPPWGSVWMPVYEVLGSDFLYPDPYNLVIFPDNHDMSRIFTQLGEDTTLWRMAMVLYLTMRGIPQFLYGTEILMSHPGTDSHGEIRSDFPGGWPGDSRNAFTLRGFDEETAAEHRFLQKLLNWRKTAKVIHDGKLMQFTPVANVYAYFRYDADDTVMVVFNRGESHERLDTTRFAERIGNKTTAIDIISGKTYVLTGQLLLEPKSVLLLALSD